jgi:hypothetical protein
MIVEKIWNDYKWETIRYRGWFLFGIVPLFIKQTSHSYHNIVNAG